MNQPERQSERETSPPKPNLLQVMISTLAAAFGVQSEKNRQRDFTRGSVWTYIFAGLLFTAFFVLGVALLVKLVLSSAGVN